MAATEIIYIDANRQMSKKSDTLNNIWEYQLSDEALVLPAGSQITIQDTFVNKRGAGGQSIEIEDDIDEMIDFGFYINDSPQWVPLAESTSDPNVEDYERLYDNALVPHSDSNNAIRFKRNPAKNYMGTNQDWGFANTHGRAITYFPEKLGGSNTPLPAVHMNGGGGKDIDADYKNCDIRPFTKEVNVFIPKGVYGLTELSLLITDQMNGKLTNVKNGDYVEDYVKKRLNRPNIIMNQDINENETTYCKKNPLHSAGQTSATENFTQAYANYGNSVGQFKLYGCSTRVPVVAPGANRNVGIPFTEDNIREIDIIGISQAQLTEYTNPAPQPGANPHKMININGEYFTYESVIPFRNDGTYGDLSFASFRDVRRGKMRGLASGTGYTGCDVPYQYLDASAPKKHRRWNPTNFEASPIDQLGPTGVGQIVLIGTQFGRADLSNPSGRAGDNMNMRFPREDVALFTTPESYREMMRDMKMPASKPEYTTTINRYKASIQLQPRMTPPNILGDGAIGVDSLSYNYGRPFFQIDYMDLYRFDDLSRRSTFGDQAKNFDYNPMRRGMFLGTPDLELNWDETKSSFTFNYLHQSHRIPSHDQYANPIEGDGTECIEFKRLAQKCRTGSPNNASEVYNADYVHPSVAGSFENPQRRLGGIMVYNWARKIAQKYSDIDWRNPDIMNQECVGNGPDAYHSGNYLTFEDYFSAPDKAKAAWAKTIWHKLGFSYNQMANPGSYEQERRMDVIPDDPNDRKTQDMRLYGMTTTGDISVSINPTISTTYNDNEKLYHEQEVAGNIRAYNNLDINTPFLPFTTDGTITKAEAGRTGDGDLDGDVDNSKSYVGSMFELMSTALVSTQGRPIQAQNLPVLNNNGYLVVNSDIIDTHSDSIKNGQNMCMLGIIPLGTFSSQDFITNSNQMVHIVGQTKIINSIKINIVNPDLTPADLDENSSVILKIVRPVQQPEHITNTRVEAAVK